MHKQAVCLLFLMSPLIAAAQTQQSVLIDDMESVVLWQAGEPGASASAERKIIKQGRQALRFEVKVDHKIGPTINGKVYLKSWPKVKRPLFPAMNLSAVDGIEFDIYVKANRKSLDKAPIILLLRDNIGGTFQKGIQVAPDCWTHIKLPFGKFQRSQVSHWQFYVCERVYQHGDRISFIIDNVRGYIDKPGQDAKQYLACTAEGLKQLKAMKGDAQTWDILNRQWQKLDQEFKSITWENLKQADAFTNSCKRLEQKVARALLMQRTKNVQGDSSYAVGVETSLRKVFLDDLNFQPGKTIRMNLAGNERESAQILIHPFTQNIKKIKVQCSDLTGPAGAKISAGKVSVNAVGYINVPPPSYVIDRGGWWPDPLLPMDWPGSGKKGLGPQADWFVQQGQTQPLWVTVRCPANMPAGEYRGTITISPDNLPATTMKLKVKVRSFSLPIRPRLKTAFSTSETAVASFNHVANIDDSSRRTLNDFILRHKLNPMSLYGPYSSPPVKEAEYLYKNGLNALAFGYCPPAMREFGKRVYYRWIRDQREYLARKGLDGLAWVYGWDEPDCRPGFESRVRQMERIFGGYLQDVIPGVPRGCTVPVDSRLNDKVTLWIPATHKYKLADAQARQKAGDHVWTYIANGPAHPYANFFVDYPAIDHRVVMWHTWQLGATGFLYYATSAWKPNMVKGPRWPAIPWNPRPLAHSNYNGDGTLFYPGEGVTPLSSQRLEIITDGIEDYDYFCLLGEGADALKKIPDADKHLIAQAYALTQIPENISAGPANYSNNPAQLQKHRDRMGDTIEKLRTALPDAIWQQLIEKCSPMAKPLHYKPSTQVASVPFAGIQAHQMKPQTSRHNKARTKYHNTDDSIAKLQAVSICKGQGWADWESPFIRVEAGRRYNLEILSQIKLTKGQVRVYLFRYNKDFCPLDHASMKHYGYAPAFLGSLRHDHKWNLQKFTKTIEKDVAYVRIYIQCFDTKCEARFGKVEFAESPQEANK